MYESDAVAYNSCMGELENESKRRARRNQIRDIVLGSVKAAGILAIAVVAPNVIGAMNKFGLLPSPRQVELVGRSYRRLIASGLLSSEGKYLRLTPRGEAELRKRAAGGYSVRKPLRWDKKWRVLIFDIPEKQKELRDKVRNTLQAIGFKWLQDSVWVYPHDCEDFIALLKADFKIGKDLLYVIAEAIENDRVLRDYFEVYPP